MFARPEGVVGNPKVEKEKDHYYGCGWLVRPVGENKFNFFHTGALSGTATILVGRHDGLAWAVLFNSRADASGAHLGSVVDPLVHIAAGRVKDWPKRDLFMGR